VSCDELQTVFWLLRNSAPPELPNELLQRQFGPFLGLGLLLEVSCKKSGNACITSGRALLCTPGGGLVQTSSSERAALTDWVATGTSFRLSLINPPSDDQF
jgi:hypothetical protein